MTDSGRPGALVVDDDAAVRAMLVEYLTVSGFDVREAENGLEALLHVKRERPRVILLDLHMPRLNGLDVVQRIRAFDRTTRVVVVTGDQDRGVHDRAMRLGASCVLTKPLDFSALDAALGQPSQERAGAGPAEEAPAPPGGAAAGPGRQVGPGALILIVDDDPEIRAVLEELMATKGHRTRAAGDALAALRSMGEQAPDIVLLDIQMPGLKGSDALPAILALAPRAKVIMVSGTDSTEIARRSLAGGAFDYVVKPIDLDYLARSVETAWSMKQAGL
jgi:DNA-binding NtrC family response regulator